MMATTTKTTLARSLSATALATALAASSSCETELRTAATTVKWIREGRPVQDPFIMAGMHDDHIPAGEELDATPGFPQHPHRGMETITYVLDGVVDHADTEKASGRYSNGDIQWMTAGSGLCHSEVSPVLHMNAPNKMELFQLWLNLPSKRKLCKPHTSMSWREDNPVVEAHGVALKTIAGPTALPANPDSWAADPANAVQILHAKIAAGSTFNLTRAALDSDITVYVFKGATLEVPNGRGTATVSGGSAVAFDRHGEATIPLRNCGNGELEVLVLEGRPIGEPVVARGPFVMNTNEEILQAFQDYHTGSWSTWPWAVDGPMHGDAPRFADDGQGQREHRGEAIRTVSRAINDGEVSYMPGMKANGWKADRSRY